MQEAFRIFSEWGIPMLCFLVEDVLLGFLILREACKIILNKFPYMKECRTEHSFSEVCHITGVPLTRVKNFKEVYNKL